MSEPIDMKFDYVKIKQNLTEYFIEKDIVKDEDFDGLMLSREKVEVLFNKN